jgi:hypothetical protein
VPAQRASRPLPVVSQAGAAAYDRPDVTASVASTRAWLAGILAGGLLIRLALMPFGEFVTDIGVFRFWAQVLLDQPRSEFYSVASEADHLPADLWLLWGIAQLHGLAGSDPATSGGAFTRAIKLVGVLADTGIIAMLFVLGRRLVDARAGLRAAALVAFNPAIIFVSAIWGQWDALSCLLSLVALWFLLARRYELSLPALTVAVLIKPQFAVFLPFFLVAVVAHARSGDIRPSRRRLAGSAIPARVAAGLLLSVLVFCGLAVPFNVGAPPLSTEWTIFERVSFAFDQYQALTLGALNIWELPFFDRPRGDRDTLLLGIRAQWAGTLFFALAYGWAFVRYVSVSWRARRPSEHVLVWALFVVAFAWFMLPTRAHERYLFTAVIFAALLAALAPRILALYAALSLTYLLNLYDVYQIYNDAPLYISEDRQGTRQLIALANLVLLLLSLFLLPWVFRARRTFPVL